MNTSNTTPGIPNGRAVILTLISRLAPGFRYEPGIFVTEGDLVMIHRRYSGWGPKPLVAVDIFRAVDGKGVQHRDVLQEEVAASATANGNPMFSGR